MTEDNAALTATIKAGAGYDAPWIVVRADNPQQLAERLNAVANLTGPLVAAAQVLQGEWNGQQGGGGQSNPGNQNFGNGGNQGGNSGGFQGQGNGGFNGNQNQGSGGSKSCAHGAMVYREGVGQKGPWKAYFCPNKDRNNQCDPEWVK